MRSLGLRVDGELHDQRVSGRRLRSMPARLPPRHLLSLDQRPAVPAVQREELLGLRLLQLRADISDSAANLDPAGAKILFNLNLVLDILLNPISSN